MSFESWYENDFGYLEARRPRHFSLLRETWTARRNERRQERLLEAVRSAAPRPETTRLLLGAVAAQCMAHDTGALLERATGSYLESLYKVIDGDETANDQYSLILPAYAPDQLGYAMQIAYNEMTGDALLAEQVSVPTKQAASIAYAVRLEAMNTVDNMLATTYAAYVAGRTITVPEVNMLDLPPGV